MIVNLATLIDTIEHVAIIEYKDEHYEAPFSSLPSVVHLYNDGSVNIIFGLQLLVIRPVVGDETFDVTYRDYDALIEDLQNRRTSLAIRLKSNIMKTFERK